MASETPESDETVEVPPDLDEPPPRYATGSDGNVPGSDTDQPSTVLVDDPGTGVPEASAPPIDNGPDNTDDPTTAEIEVNAQGDGGDPGLLEQVADAVGDLWGDAKDVVT